ncbi:hypothetical protein S40285_10180, partial [Stachybotrys chlorohalonatus IBT 40285]
DGAGSGHRAPSTVSVRRDANGIPYYAGQKREGCEGCMIGDDAGVRNRDDCMRKLSNPAEEAAQVGRVGGDLVGRNTGKKIKPASSAGERFVRNGG